MSERHEAEAPVFPTSPVVPTVDQQAVFDLMKQRLFELFGPGGSFTVTLGRATAEDAVFVSTLAETVAWQVAAALEPTPRHEAQHSRVAEAQPEHEILWAHIEKELLRQRTGDESLTVARRAA